MVLNQSIGVTIMNDALDRLRNNLKNETVVVATSGGPDSMALLHLVNSLKKELNLKIVCAHVNHKLRIESEAEAVMVEEFCIKNDIFFEFMTIDTYNDDNFHNDARIKRYDFFEKTVNKCKAKHLLTAHHGDDLMETVLMRIVRGSSLKGYAGFSEKSQKENYTILRPLITYTKDEILSYVQENKIPYAVDKSNEKDVYTRNRFRKYILPPLKNEDKNVHHKFYKFNKTLEMYDDYINKEANKHQNEVYQNEVLNISKFKNLDQVIRLKIINQILEKFYQDDLMLITDKHTELIEELIFSEKPNQIINLPNNKTVVKSYNQLSIKKNNPKENYKLELSDFITLPNQKTIKIIKETNSNSNNICRLNIKDLKLPLYIRNKEDGDKIEIKGLNGTKKIKDIFIDEKIPVIERRTWPILVDSEGVVLWIPGLRKSKFDKQKDENYDIILEYI